MALCISRLNSCVVLLFSFALLHLVQGTVGNNPTSNSSINSTSVLPVHVPVNTSTHIIQPSSSVPLTSSNVPLNSTIIPQNPNNTQTVHPIHTATASQNTTASSTNVTGSSARPTNRTNSVHIVTTTPTTHASPTQPMTTKEPAKDKNDDSMKKRMWVAASFAILFAITTVILAYLVYRQRKINRELEGDPQTARLL